MSSCGCWQQFLNGYLSKLRKVGFPGTGGQVVVEIAGDLLEVYSSVCQGWFLSPGESSSLGWDMLVRWEVLCFGIFIPKYPIVVIAAEIVWISSQCFFEGCGSELVSRTCALLDQTRICTHEYAFVQLADSQGEVYPAFWPACNAVCFLPLPCYPYKNVFGKWELANEYIFIGSVIIARRGWCLRSHMRISNINLFISSNHSLGCTQAVPVSLTWEVEVNKLSFYSFGSFFFLNT